MDRRRFVQGSALAGILASRVGAFASAPVFSPQPGIVTNDTGFVVAGLPRAWYSGEVHFFRTPATEWARTFKLLQEAGANCVATYLPWIFLEPQRGSYALTGENSFARIELYLKHAQDAGLYVFARPGPYCGSELRTGGLPLWLYDDESFVATNLDGRPLPHRPASYMHPGYRKLAWGWFDYITRWLAPHMVSQGGPVALLQLDNELTGAHLWGGGLDYNPETFGFGHEDGRYATFLRRRYGSIAEVNRIYGTDWRSFSDASPEEHKGVHGMAVKADYLDCYIASVTEFAVGLGEIARRNGIHEPLVFNVGEAAMHPVYREMRSRIAGSLIVSSDMYYNLGQSFAQNSPTPQSIIDAFCSLEMLRIMGYPKSIAELQSGSPESWPLITANDEMAWYRSMLAMGMNGCNYYMFRGGRNVAGSGATSDSYDYQAPIGEHGEIRPLYEVQKEIGLFLHERQWLQNAPVLSDCRVLFDLDNALAHWYSQAEELAFSPAASWAFLRKGILSTLFSAGACPALVDVNDAAWASELSTPAVVCSSSRMSRVTQTRLVQFVQQGGQLLVVPVIPTLDEHLRPCTILLDALQGSPQIRLPSESVRLSVAGIANVQANGSTFASSHVPTNEVMGTDEVSSAPICWQRTLGKGSVIVLGMSWEYARTEHAQMLACLLVRLKHEALVEKSNPALWCTLRSDGKTVGVSLLNLFNASLQTTLRVRADSTMAWHDLGVQNIGAISVLFLERTLRSVG